MLFIQVFKMIQELCLIKNDVVKREIQSIDSCFFTHNLLLSITTATKIQVDFILKSVLFELSTKSQFECWFISMLTTFF